MKKYISKTLLLGSFITILVVISCQPELVEPVTPLENEYISTVKIIYVNPADTADKGVARWADLDNNPATHADTSTAILNLKKNSQYNLEILFLNETKSPIDTISKEVKARSIFHLICITPLTPFGLTATPTDMDGNNPALPLGLKYRVLTDSTLKNGMIRLKLKHQPSGKNGSCELGSADADVRFRVVKVN
ncbi:MAG: hypothetical protein RI894_1832 [Bacteroidota bacterium]|jgi:hypothetical protein